MVKKMIKRLFIIMLFGLVAQSAVAQQSAYITNHRLFASLLAAHYGIPASVILAVATVESAAGEAPVARVLNNHFGMVGENKYINRRGNKSRYKQYDNEYASYIDFCELISHKKFYARLRNNTDPKAWVRALSHCGYSECPAEWEQHILNMLSATR